MEPRVTKRERKLQLTYDLSHRIRCAQIYPTTAPNGSTLIFYGHDRGVKVLWRGGRRVKQRAPSQPAPAKQQDVIMIDDSDDEAPPPAASNKAVEYEDDEDEMNPDAPYPSIIQELDIQLDSPVLHLAIPFVSSQPSQRPALAKHTALLAVSTVNGKVDVLQIPLAPPYPASSRDAAQAILEDRLQLPSGKTPARDISIKLLAQFGDDKSLISRSDEPKHTLLVAAASNTLHLWRVPIQSGKLKSSEVTQQKVHLPSHSSKVSFSNLASSARILLADIHGALRIYDPFALQDSSVRPSSSDGDPPQPEELGHWLITLLAPFQLLQQGRPTLPTRKKIVDAKWVLSGRAILVLLEDGEWGFWDINGLSQSNKSIDNFVLNGYVGSAGAVESTESAKPKRGASKLAPMTPNTRKAKADDLFSGTPKAPGTVAQGGISVTTTESVTGQSEESVMLWYNNNIYTITNLWQFWQRNVNNSGSGTGSLYSSGFARVPDLKLMNESITSVAQFSARASSSGLGQMNTARDFLVSAEHRYVISQSTRPPVPSRGLFQQLAPAAAAPAPNDRDQRMLDAGELDIGGMDRMLDSMSNGDARPRRVGFAH